MSGELQLCFGPPRVTGPKPPDAWTTVGKRGKALRDFPVGTPRDATAAEPKRLAAPASSDSKPRKLARKASGSKPEKVMKCSVM